MTPIPFVGGYHAPMFYTLMGSRLQDWCDQALGKGVVEVRGLDCEWFVKGPDAETEQRALEVIRAKAGI